MDYTTHYDSPLGGITLASDGEALIGLWFDGQKYFAEALDKHHEERNTLPIFEETRHWLDIYFSGKVPDFKPKLCMRASDFRKRVWEIMLTIINTTKLIKAKSLIIVPFLLNCHR